MLETIASSSTHPKVGRSKAVRCRHVVGGLGCVSIVRIDVRQQGAHDGGHAGAHVLRRQAGKVAAKQQQRFTA